MKRDTVHINSLISTFLSYAHRRTAAETPAPYLTQYQHSRVAYTIIVQPTFPGCAPRYAPRESLMESQFFAVVFQLIALSSALSAHRNPITRLILISLLLFFSSNTLKIIIHFCSKFIKYRIMLLPNRVLFI